MMSLKNIHLKENEHKVVSQIENLLSYPLVKERVESGVLHLHGWMYDIESGDIDYYDPDAKKFQKLSDIERT